MTYEECLSKSQKRQKVCSIGSNSNEPMPIFIFVDMCRKHHFLLLRTALDKEISTGKGQNLLGEIIKAWKKKVSFFVKKT